MEQEQKEKSGFSLMVFRFWQKRNKETPDAGQNNAGQKNIWNHLKFSKDNFKRLSVVFGIYALCVLFLEIFYHIFAYGEIGGRIYIPIIFGIFWGLVFSLITMMFRPKAQPFVGIFLFAAAWVLVSAQLIYYHIFGSSLSFSQFGMGTDAVTSFWHELLSAVGDIWYQLLILLLPAAGLFLGYRFHFIKKEKYPLRTKGYSLLCVVLFYFCSLGFLFLGGTNAYGCYDLYHSSSMSTDLSVRGLGVLTTARLELKYMIFGCDQDLSDVLASEAAEEELSDTDIYNMIDIDFDTMITSETDEDLITLDEYFSAQEATNKNDYTGYFEGYNLIELCCESFSPVFIDKELTPILYEMYTNGFIFNNFYTSWESNTTNGEYSLCMGIFPDNSRSKSNGSFKASADNYVPYCLGNMFGSIDVNAYGYHNYEGWYYARSYTYPNMGLTCKFAEDGMSFTNSWPSSDLEMMEQSISDYIDDEQFFVHYMTFSGHYRYDYDLNAMVRGNWDIVADLDYSDEVKAYISCNLELEYALQYLVQELKASGQYENTVISLTCDHFPYGLTLDEYSELAGYEVDDDFGKYENAFILWSPSMEEPVEVDDPICTVDILPTILNLWGFTYDSRLLVGKDIFSNADHVGILSNGSFITDKIKYNSSTGEVTYLVDESEISESYVDDWVNEVKRRFTISTEILNTDYYRVLSDFLKIADVNVDTRRLNSSGGSTTGNTGSTTMDDY
jgi:hypothetical protein